MIVQAPAGYVAVNSSPKPAVPGKHPEIVEMPVIAFDVVDGVAIPITAEIFPQDAILALRFPDGRINSKIGTFKSIETFIAALDKHTSDAKVAAAKAAADRAAQREAEDARAEQLRLERASAAREEQERLERTAHEDRQRAWKEHADRVAEATQRARAVGGGYADRG